MSRRSLKYADRRLLLTSSSTTASTSSRRRSKQCTHGYGSGKRKAESFRSGRTTDWLYYLHRSINNSTSSIISQREAPVPQHNNRTHEQQPFFHHVKMIGHSPDSHVDQYDEDEGILLLLMETEVGLERKLYTGESDDECLWGRVAPTYLWLADESAILWEIQSWRVLIGIREPRPHPEVGGFVRIFRFFLKSGISEHECNFRFQDSNVIMYFFSVVFAQVNGRNSQIKFKDRIISLSINYPRIMTISLFIRRFYGYITVVYSPTHIYFHIIIISTKYGTFF